MNYVRTGMGPSGDPLEGVAWAWLESEMMS
jgi:hypothetical protein